MDRMDRFYGGCRAGTGVDYVCISGNFHLSVQISIV